MARKFPARPVVVLAFAVFAQVVLLASPSAALRISVAHARIVVSPHAGSPTTSFVVGFRAPQKTGRTGSVERRYQVSVSGPSGATGCVSTASASLPFTRAHHRVHMTLSPAKLGGQWCAGSFKGQIEEIESPVCVRAIACPEFVLLLGTVGKFSFAVSKPAGGGAAPTFAGIKSAVACTPGAQRPGETTPFTLTWDQATDPATPSDEIVYDIYESGTAGGENFSTPTWTSAPGVTSFRTPGLPSHGTFYFVVRARDQAGNEDPNRVELRGSDPCL